MAKLTLSADRDVIAAAKAVAAERGTSVSELFSQFVAGLVSARTPSTAPRVGLPPITRRLKGLAKVSGDPTDRELLERAISERHRP
ncbi:MAG: DUF6364 family protein [Planctomycetota bacterium]|nr:DUF6364 family protein [Planctomycetota bacterium]